MINRLQLEFMKMWSDDKLKAGREYFIRQSMYAFSRREMEGALNFALAIGEELKRRGVVG
jgi:hypothetical protein